MPASSFRLGFSLIAIPAAIILSLSSCSVIGQASDVVQGKSDVFSLKVGDCFNDEDVETISSVKVLDCKEEHDNEIYHEYQLASDFFSGATYDEDKVLEDADGTCFSEFETFIAASFDDTRLNFSYLFPTSEGWDDDDRAIQCIAYLEDGKVPESLEAKGADYLLE